MQPTPEIVIALQKLPALDICLMDYSQTGFREQLMAALDAAWHIHQALSIEAEATAPRKPGVASRAGAGLKKSTETVVGDAVEIKSAKSPRNASNRHYNNTPNMAQNERSEVIPMAKKVKKPVKGGKGKPC